MASPIFSELKTWPSYARLWNVRQAGLIDNYRKIAPAIS
jgi:hypothetical protein